MDAGGTFALGPSARSLFRQQRQDAVNEGALQSTKIVFLVCEPAQDLQPDFRSANLAEYLTNGIVRIVTELWDPILTIQSALHHRQWRQLRGDKPSQQHRTTPEYTSTRIPRRARL
jgi:hypothetical protein